MENGLFAYILRYSRRQQIVLTLMTVISFPFYYLSLDLPKTIINDAISGSSFPVNASVELLGFTLHFGTYAQVPYLLLLCLAFLLLVLINSGFKLFINIYRGMLGERMLRRMRLQLIERIMNFPLSRFRRTSQGELVSMVNQETEPLGGFIGEAISLPLYQGGLLLTILVFMFVQDWKLGLAAVSLYPIQAWLIPKLQRQVNLLNQTRTIRMRGLAENLGEVVAGINEVHINNNSTFFRDHFSKLLGGIFNIRVQIYKKKFLIKFLNNSFAQLTPFLFFLIGGLLVIQGDLSVGALVAALAAYKDLSPPWKELLSWYQGQADARLKYCILTEQFQIDDNGLPSDGSPPASWDQTLQNLPIVANNISFRRIDGILELDNVSMNVDQGEWVSLVGKGTSGKNGLAQLFACLINPTSGKVLIAEHDTRHIPRTVTGRTIAYVGHESYLFAQTIRDNLLLSLKHTPQNNASKDHIRDDTIEFSNWQEEARLSGNSDVEPSTDWVDYKGAGVSDAVQLTARIGEVLNTVEVADDLVRNALARTIDPSEYSELAAAILQARDLFKEQILLQGLGSIVEFLDPYQYNDNTSLADNILFGASDLEEFSAKGLSKHPVLLPLLQQHGLSDVLDETSISAATTIVELFADLPSGHEFFARYGFVDADDLIQLQRILGLLKKVDSIDSLNASDRALIRAIPFGLIDGRHRVGVLPDDAKQGIVKVRAAFAKSLNAESRQQIEFFSPERYNAFTSISENIIFGRIVYGRLGAENKVYSVMLDVLQRLDLISLILDIGLAAPAGLAGSLLTNPQQQKLLLARGLIKQPKVLVINDGLNALDDKETISILSNIKQNYPQMSLLWVDSKVRMRELFDRFAHLQAGKLTRLEKATETRDNTDESLFGTNGANAPPRSANSVDDDEKLALIKTIPLFQMMDHAHLKLLASSCDCIDIPKGERLFNQGDPGDALYIVVDGKAGIFASTADSEKKIGECSINEVFGELALLSDNPRSASVEAITDLAILRLKREIFIDMVRSNGDVGYQILQVVTNRFINSKQKSERSVES